MGHCSPSGAIWMSGMTAILDGKIRSSSLGFRLPPANLTNLDDFDAGRLGHIGHFQMFWAI
jgi:hypothetical protein